MRVYICVSSNQQIFTFIIWEIEELKETNAKLKIQNEASILSSDSEKEGTVISNTSMT